MLSRRIFFMLCSYGIMGSWYCGTVCDFKGGYLTPLDPFDSVRAMAEHGAGNGKRQIGPRIDKNLAKEVHILAIHKERSFNELIEEALRDLLKKYCEKRRDAR